MKQEQEQVLVDGLAIREALAEGVAREALSLIQGCLKANCTLYSLEFLTGHLGTLERLSGMLGLGSLVDILENEE